VGQPCITEQRFGLRLWASIDGQVAS
jgi:hypothetical protein